jgi:hypothetical protein
MVARNRVGTGLSYGPTRLHMLAELIPLNRFLGPLKVYKFGKQQTIIVQAKDHATSLNWWRGIIMSYYVYRYSIITYLN